MLAVRFAELGSISAGRLAEVPEPICPTDGIVLRIEAVPVNFVDLVTMRGDYQFAPTLPYTPGKGPAGIVTAVGPNVVGLAPGHRVLAMVEYGGYAQHVAAPADQVYELPPGLSTVDAAAMSLAFDTAWMALRDRARIQPGDRLLVLGASGAVGRAAIQLGRQMGAAMVIAGVSTADRVVPPGADHVVVVGGRDARESVRDDVLALTGGQGVDVVIDPIGGTAFAGALRALAWRGRLVVVGFASGQIPEVRTNYLLVKNIELSGLQISDYRRRRPELMRRAFAEIFEWYEAGHLVAPPSTTYPLDEWRDAVAAVADGADRRRVVLTP